MKLFTGTVLGRRYSMKIERTDERAEIEMLIADESGEVIDSISRLYDSGWHIDTSDDALRSYMMTEARENLRDHRYG